MSKIPQQCAPRNRCRNFRRCETCARIRQARIADQAEQLLSGHLQLQLIVLKPLDHIGATLRRGIQACIRNNNLPAGIWTIEKGPKTGLIHANILTQAAPIKALKGIDTHSEIARNNARIIAAYISKREQIPAPEHWTGRTYASWGHISHTLNSEKMPAIIHGCAVENALRIAHKEPLPEEPALRASAPHNLSQQEYAEIAARHLPRLAALGKAMLSDREGDSFRGSAHLIWPPPASR